MRALQAAALCCAAASAVALPLEMAAMETAAIAIFPSSTHGQIQVAASELARYLFVSRASSTLPLVILPGDARRGSLDMTTFVIGTSSDLGLPADVLPAAVAGPDAYTINVRGPVTYLVGASERSALYAVYGYLERLGLRFYLSGATLPAAPPSLLADGYSERAAPVFAHRGLQPFHDFCEGPDWWGEDEQKRVIESILAMRGNTLAYHTYPIADPTCTTGCNEPAMWIGLKEDVNADGTVNKAYPTSWCNTLKSAWGLTPINTSDYGWGAASVFEHDCFGHEAQSGRANLCPVPKTDADSVELFNRVGAMWQTVFKHGAALGVDCILGTEAPLSTPPPPGGAHVPLGVWYALSRDDHFVTTTDCAECSGLYVLQGVEGYASTTAEAGLIPVSTYYSGQWTDNVLLPGAMPPPDASYGLVRVEGYILPTGQAPNGTAPLVQYVKGNHHFAAAGASAAANATAAGFSASYTLGNVWTTGTPPVSSQDYYEGALLRLQRLLGTDLAYVWSWTPEDWEWSKVPVTDPVVQDVVHDAAALQAARDAVYPTAKLATCGWVIGPLGARWYFDSVLPSEWAMSSIDQEVGNTDVDPAYLNITHRTSDNKWVIPWAEDDPGLTAPELWVNRTLSHAREALNYSAFGLLIIHWRTRMTSPQIGAAHAVAWDPTLDSTTYWADFSLAQFGASSVAASAAAVFVGVDSFALPRPVNWIGGPGGLAADASKCDWATLYTWVDAFTVLRPAMLSAIAAGQASQANLERFDYWATQFVYMRGIARMECDWAGYAAVLKAVQGITDPAKRQAAAVTQGIPAYASLVANTSTMMFDLLASASGVDTMGTVANVISHSLYQAVGPAPAAVLSGLTGAPLPPSCALPAEWDATRAPQLRVPVQRSMLGAGEPFRVRAFVLATPAQAPTALTLFTRPLGGGAWATTPLAPVPSDGTAPRYVYGARLPAQAQDFAWYLTASLPGNVSAYTGGLGIPAGTSFNPDGTLTLTVPPDGAAGPQSVVITSGPAGAAVASA